METTEVSFNRWLIKMWYIYNRILLSHEKGWNGAICHHMAGYWEYHAKWNKSVGKSQEPSDFTNIGDTKMKATHEQSRQTKTQTQTTAWWLPEGKEVGSS